MDLETCVTEDEKIPVSTEWTKHEKQKVFRMLEKLRKKLRRERQDLQREADQDLLAIFTVRQELDGVNTLITFLWLHDADWLEKNRKRFADYVRTKEA